MSRKTFNLDGATVASAKFGGDATEVKFRIDNPESGTDTVTYQSRAIIHPDLKKAIEALEADLLALSEIPQTEGNTVAITGVSFKESDSGSRGAVLKGKRGYRNSNGVQALNTPVKYADDPVERRRFDAPTWSRIETLEAELLAFVGGKQSQGELFEDGKAEDRPPEKGEAFDDGGANLRKIENKMGKAS